MNEDGTTAPVSVTLKAGSGYDAPWIVFRGDEPEEVYSELRKLESDDEFLRCVATVATAFRGVYAEHAGATSEKTPAGSTPGVTNASPNAPVCTKCGASLTWQTWSKKDGSRTFSAWKCPSGSFGHDVDWKTPAP